MSFFKFLKKRKGEQHTSTPEIVDTVHENKGRPAMTALAMDLTMTADEKDMLPKSSEADLLGIFAEYFAPNAELYTKVGTPAYTAYFGTIELAKRELMSNISLFEKATKWSRGELLEVLNDPKPGVTSMVLLGLIFRMGWYCVIRSTLTCIDFCEEIPNCIALYLLLIAKKKPSEARKQLIDTGDPSDPKQLQQAFSRLKVCDPNWNPIILNAMDLE